MKEIVSISFSFDDVDEELWQLRIDYLDSSWLDVSAVDKAFVLKELHRVLEEEK
jgi:hypothetical protein